MNRRSMAAGEPQLGLEHKEKHTSSNEHVSTEPTLMEVMRAIEILNGKVALIMNKNQEEDETSKTAAKKKTCVEPDRHTSKASEGNTFLKRREAPTRQVDISVFTGENPEGWVLEAERYFLFYSSTEEEKKETAFYSMSGEALIWFLSEESQQPMLTWGDFKQRLLLRFGSGQRGSPYARLMNLKQIKLVAEYRRQFEEITATSQELPQEFLEEAFLNGLKPEIAEEVKLFCSTGLSRLKEMAQKIENKNIAILRDKYSPSLVHTMTFKEVEEKKAKGICYRCGAKDDKGHQCSGKDLKIMLVETGNGEDSVENGDPYLLRSQVPLNVMMCNNEKENQRMLQAPVSPCTSKKDVINEHHLGKQMSPKDQTRQSRGALSKLIPECHPTNRSRHPVLEGIFFFSFVILKILLIFVYKYNL